MPQMNYCKYCQVETPVEEKCPYCNKKLAKTGLRYIAHSEYKQSSDLNSWKVCLRIIVPLYLLLMLVVLIGEAASGGFVAAKLMIDNGFFLLFILIFLALLLIIWLFLDFRGKVTEFSTVSENGLSVRLMLKNPSSIQLALWLHTQSTVNQTQEHIKQSLPKNCAVIRETQISWEKIKRIRLLQPSKTVIVYHPKWWQVMLLHCNQEDWFTLQKEFMKKGKKYNFIIQEK